MEENKETTQPSEGTKEGGQAQPPVESTPAGTEEGQVSAEVSKEARMWAMLCHLLGFFTSFIGPLIIWLIKKDEDSFIDKQGKEALNFQITVAIAWIVSVLLIAVCIGIVMLIAVGTFDLVFCIVACVKANEGKDYRYPVSIRFIK